MGEAAEDCLDGTVCEGCGELFDDILDGGQPPGFPRRCRSCGGQDDRVIPAAKPPRTTAHKARRKRQKANRKARDAEASRAKTQGANHNV